MDLFSLPWDASTMGSEDCFENVTMLDKQPFANAEEELSDECIASVFQENPFVEARPGAPQGERGFEPAGRRQNWSAKIHGSVVRERAVQSAPEMRGACWGRGDNGETHSLPVCGCGLSDAIQRITGDVAADLVRRRIEREYLFVDARFWYEYRGGHVRGAVNISEPQRVRELLKEPKILVFYCEFSSARGPRMAKALRSLDRSMNQYPALRCPEIYVLEGGYSQFYGKYPELCEPRAYTRMHDRRFKRERAEEHRKRRMMKY